MKRILAAVSFAVFAAPVLATPFEQTELDRQLPALKLSAPAGAYVADGSAPFEQSQFNRGLPNFGAPVILARASSGETRSDREIAVNAGAAGGLQSPWINDHNFIAPAK